MFQVQPVQVMTGKLLLGYGIWGVSSSSCYYCCQDVNEMAVKVSESVSADDAHIRSWENVCLSFSTDVHVLKPESPLSLRFHCVCAPETSSRRSLLTFDIISSLS